MKNLILSAVSVTDEGYVCVLADKTSDRKIPIVIRDSDAYFINTLVERRNLSQLSSYDLFAKMMDKLGNKIDELTIKDYNMGIYDCVIVASNVNSTYEIFHCNISDIIIYSYLYGIDINIDEKLLNIVSYRMNNDGTMSEEMMENNKESDIERKKLESITTDKILNPAPVAITKVEQVNIDNLASITDLQLLNQTLDFVVQNEDYIFASSIQNHINSIRNSVEHKELLDGNINTEEENKPKKRGRKKKGE